MQIMVCGSIGYGGIDEVKGLYSLLEKEGFTILNHIISKGMDYSHITDFRSQRELAGKIVEHDLEYVKKADILVILANKASYGTAVEMFVAKRSAKKVILFAKNPILTPWPIYFSDYIVTSLEALLSLLKKINASLRMSNPEK